MNFFMGETPLHKAVFLRKIDVIHCLLSEGADLNIRDVRNRTVTQCADEYLRRELTNSSQYY
jgi:ankyrin repeat protein